MLITANRHLALAALLALVGAPIAVADTAAPGQAPVASEPNVTTPPPIKPIANTREWSCSVIESAAETRGLPLEFFVRLIRQESNFNPIAVSPAGAQGIAQFMPGTARERGLEDPFDPVTSIYESARWLAELRAEFGNLGLAAAAYNAGPQRVTDWLAGRRSLPGETRAYVTIITGMPAEHWADRKKDDATPPAKRQSCIELAKRHEPVRSPRAAAIDEPKENWGPWGLQLAGGWSKSQALMAYRRLQKKYAPVLGDREPMVIAQRMHGRHGAPRYLVRVAETSRASANALCARLSSLGGACLVYRN